MNECISCQVVAGDTPDITDWLSMILNIQYDFTVYSQNNETYLGDSLVLLIELVKHCDIGFYKYQVFQWHGQ